MNSRKLFIAGMALTALLMFAGCQPVQEETANTSNNGTTQGTNNVKPADTTSPIDATQQKVLDRLSQQSVPVNPVSPYSATDQAAYNAALNLLDPTFCDKITDASYKTQCQTDVTDNKLLAEAKAKLDASICDKMVSQDDKNACKIQVEAQIKLNAQANLQQSQADQEQKLMTQIVQSGDYTRCKELAIEADKTDCELNILVNKAITAKDVTWCDKTSTAETKQRCVNAYNETMAKPQT